MNVDHTAADQKRKDGPHLDDNGSAVATKRLCMQAGRSTSTAQVVPDNGQQACTNSSDGGRLLKMIPAEIDWASEDAVCTERSQEVGKQAGKEGNGTAPMVPSSQHNAVGDNERAESPVRAATLRFVKAILNPLYHAQVPNRPCLNAF